MISATLLSKIQAVTLAVAGLDPFNSVGGVPHPAYAYTVGNDEATQYALTAAVKDLNDYADSQAVAS